MGTKNIFNEWGIIITLLLIALPIIVASILAIVKAKAIIKNYLEKKEQERFYNYIKDLTPIEVEKLEQRKRAL